MTDNGLPCIDLLEATPEILRGLMTELTEEFLLREDWPEPEPSPGSAASVVSLK